MVPAGLSLSVSIRGSCPIIYGGGQEEQRLASGIIILVCVHCQDGPNDKGFLREPFGRQQLPQNALNARINRCALPTATVVALI